MSARRTAAGSASSDSSYDLAVVGLGPTGATLALLAARAGLSVVVFERSTAPYPQPRACHLDAEVARVFQQCGLADALRPLLTVSAGMEYVDAAGRHLYTFEGFEREPILGWHEDYVFVQPEIDTMLRDALAAQEHVDVHLGAEAPAVDDLLAIADWVVAADGASSSVRAALGVPLVDFGYDERWSVVDVTERPDRPLHLPTIIQQVCDSSRLATFVPSHGAHRRWEFDLGDEPEPDPWELLAPWGVTADDADLVRHAVYRFHALVADGWRGGPDGRVLLAGDAAHQMPPFMGQGLCSGVRDAANLAWKLAAVQRGGADAALLDTYEAERRPHVEEVIRLSIQAGSLLRVLADDLAAGRPLRLPDKAEPDPTRWSRLPPLPLAAPSPVTAASTPHGSDIDPFPVGHLVPQPVVPGGARACDPQPPGAAPLFDDLLGDGWALVVADAALLGGAPSAGQSPAGAQLAGFSVVVEPRATYGHAAVLVRPDRYIAAVAATPAAVPALLTASVMAEGQ